jgi:hypothetical protein
VIARRRHCNAVGDRYLVIVRLTSTHVCLVSAVRLVLEVSRPPNKALARSPGSFRTRRREARRGSPYPPVEGGT